MKRFPDTCFAVVLAHDLLHMALLNAQVRAVETAQVIAGMVEILLEVRRLRINAIDAQTWMIFWIFFVSALAPALIRIRRVYSSRSFRKLPMSSSADSDAEKVPRLEGKTCVIPSQMLSSASPPASAIRSA